MQGRSIPKQNEIAEKKLAAPIDYASTSRLVDRLVTQPVPVSHRIMRYLRNGRMTMTFKVRYFVRKVDVQSLLLAVVLVSDRVRILPT